MPLLPPPPEQALQPQLTSQLPPSHDDPIWGHIAGAADARYQQLMKSFGAPDKFGNLGKQPAKPVEPIGTQDLMSPETESLLRNAQTPWERLGIIGNATYEKLF